MKLVVQITRGIIRDTTVRRWTMFGAVLGAVVLLFCGSTFLARWLAERPVLFLVFWALCAWLTLLSMLMAVYDILVVHAQGRAARTQDRSSILGKDDPDGEG